MFQVVFNSPDLELILRSKPSRQKFLDYEISDELSPVMESLKKYGQISKAKPKRGLKLELAGIAYEFEGVTFKLIYSVLSQEKIVKIYEIERKCHLQMSVINSYLEKSSADEEAELNIVQADKPTKIIETLELIQQGINTSYEIGIKLGHKGVKHKDIARHGQYKLQAARELKLAEKYKKEGKNVYRLTEKGLLIAAIGTDINSDGKIIKKNVNKDISTQYKLMIEAMFEFSPVQFIYKNIILTGKELEVDTIKNLINTKFKPNYYSQKPTGTSERRAQCLKSWMVWVAGVSGIPVVRRDRKGCEIYLNIFPLR